MPLSLDEFVIPNFTYLADLAFRWRKNEATCLLVSQGFNGDLSGEKVVEGFVIFDFLYLGIS